MKGCEYVIILSITSQKNIPCSNTLAYFSCHQWRRKKFLKVSTWVNIARCQQWNEFKTIPLNKTRSSYFHISTILPFISQANWSHDIQHSDIQHNGIQHNDIQHNDIQHNAIKYIEIMHNDIKHNDIKHNDIKHNDIQHFDNQHNDIQHFDIQHNDIQHNYIQHRNLQYNNIEYFDI